MKFKLHWLDRNTEVVEGDDFAKACNNAGIGNGAVKALDHFEKEVKLSDIAHGRLGITTQVASFYIDELAGYPNLSEGLEIMRAATIHSWTMFSKDADEFVRRVEEYREKMLQ